MKISFVIVTWNCLKQIQECVRTIKKLEIPDSEIVIVDAHSQDGTPEYLSTVEGIQLVKMDHKDTWSYNNDLGISLAHGEWICIMNPDIYFNETFKDTLDVLYSSKEPYPIVSPQLIYPDGKIQANVVVLTFNRMIKHFTILGAYAYRIIHSHSVVDTTYPGNNLNVRNVEYKHPSGHIVRKLTWTHPRGSLFIINRKTVDLFNNILWRKGMTLMAADSDMFRMAFEKGIDILLVPSSQIIHEEGHVTKKQYQPIIDRESTYGFILFSRYWNEHPIMFTLICLIDILFSFFVAPFRSKTLSGKKVITYKRLSFIQFLHVFQMRAVAKTLGMIDAWRVKLQK